VEPPVTPKSGGLPAKRHNSEIIDLLVSGGVAMSKNWMAIAFAVFFGCGISQAHPLDSPDIVYIDGLPCNAA
jgi:hypothetical protein